VRGRCPALLFRPCPTRPRPIWPHPATRARGKQDGEAQPKFPNKDTAKNRKDYDMGTDTGSIQLGTDEATGDTMMRHNPPKKVQEPYPYEKMPIEVRPIIVR